MAKLRTLPIDPALQRAISAASSMHHLAQMIGVSHQAISRWTRVPLNQLLAVENATGIPRHELRPDLFNGYQRNDDPTFKQQMKVLRNVMKKRRNVLRELAKQ